VLGERLRYDSESKKTPALTLAIPNWNGELLRDKNKRERKSLLLLNTNT